MAELSAAKLQPQSSDDEAFASNSNALPTAATSAGAGQQAAVIVPQPNKEVSPSKMKMIDHPAASSMIVDADEEDEWDTPFEEKNKDSLQEQEWPVQEDRNKKQQQANQEELETCDQFSDMFSDVFQGNVKEVDTQKVMERLIANKNNNWEESNNNNVAGSAKEHTTGEVDMDAGSLQQAEDVDVDKIEGRATNKTDEPNMDESNNSSPIPQETMSSEEDIVDTMAWGALAEVIAKDDAQALGSSENNIKETASSTIVSDSAEKRRERRQRRASPKRVYQTAKDESNARGKPDSDIKDPQKSPTATAQAGTASSPSSAKRRERRKLRGKPIVEVTSNESLQSLADDDNSIETMESKESLESETSVKRRERRRMRLLEHQKGLSKAGEDIGDASIQTNNTSETTTSVNTGDKRRERRKLWRGEQPKAEPEVLPVVSTEAGEVNDNDAAEDDNTVSTNSTKETLETVSTVNSSDKRRERRKFRQHQQEVDDEPPDSKEVAATPALARRQRMAEKVNSGKVYIPKALLDATPNNIAQRSASSEVASPTKRVSNSKAIKGETSPPKTPTISTKKSPTNANAPSTPTSKSPSSPRLIVTPKNEVEMKLVEEGENGEEEEIEKAIPPMPNLNLSSAPSANINEARRQRRHIRKGPVRGHERVEMALKNNTNVNEVEVVQDSTQGDLVPSQDNHLHSSPESGKKNEDGRRNKSQGFMSDNVKSTLVNVLEKDHSQRNTAARPSSPASSFVSSGPDNVDPAVSRQIAKALDNARMQKEVKDKKNDSSEDIFGLENDGGSLDDANELFPNDQSLAMVSGEPCGAAPVSDAAWDTNDASGMNAMLEQSKARNKKNTEVDGRPLLQLETTVSDNDHEEGSLEAASARLVSQKERMAMYTSGEGFGVGEDSSVDDESNHSRDASEDEDEEEDMGIEVNDNRVLFDYEDMNNVMDNAGDEELEGEALDAFNYDQVARNQDNNIPQFSMSEKDAKSRAHRWDRNPDAMSDVSFDLKSATTDGGSAVFGLRFVGSSVCSKSDEPTPPESPFELQDADATPKIGTKGTSARKSSVEGKSSPGIKMLKIPPPPQEKLRQWEESKGISQVGSRVLAQAQDANEHASPIASDGSKSRGHLDPASYKIHLPKSPAKKKKGSIEEELDLKAHKKMAERIVMASSKAARKFEEEYDSKHTRSKEAPPPPATESPFFCAGDNPIMSAAAKAQAGSSGTKVMGPAVGELVGGAFSPWKIPDRAEDESSIASSIRMLHESESYANATSAAVNSIRNHHHGHSLSTNKDDSLNESFEVSLEGREDKEEGLLTNTLKWLFDDVLPSDAHIAAKAFDIHTSTTVQSDRVRDIVNEDETFNIICKYVASNAVRHGDPGHRLEIPGHIDGADDTDVSVSDFESSFITTSSINEDESTFAQKTADRILKGKERGIEPFEIPPSTFGSDDRPSAEVLAANFVGFCSHISTVAEIPSPFGNANPFLKSVVHNITAKKHDFQPRERKTMQELVFPTENRIVKVFEFLRNACRLNDVEEVKQILSCIEEVNNGGNRNHGSVTPPIPNKESGVLLASELQAKGRSTVRRSNKSKTSHKPNKTMADTNLNLIFPDTSPSPFETAVWNAPSIISSILSFIGNPVTVCVVKRLNVFCNRVVNENQHVLMRDAVRLGGMGKYVRPSFWLWVTERCRPEDPVPLIPSRRGFESTSSSTPPRTYKGRDFHKLKESGANGKWQHIIERDVTRSFGNMPPHKTGARYRQDSIVRALVSFGKEELMRNSRSHHFLDKLPEEEETKHFKMSSRLDCRDDSSVGSGGSLVSDWGGVSPVNSFVSEDPSVNTEADKSMRIVSYENSELLDSDAKAIKLNSSHHTSRSDVSDPVLSGNALTTEMKVDLQDKLRSILHALAAKHEGVGYCQGMDYIVAHLLRVLQDTILLRVVQRSTPSQNQATSENEGQREVEDWRTISSEELRSRMSAINTHSMVVEEVVFGVMDTFFTTYNLQHMYWPELRCLKTCCRVFERVIEQKLPVLADHFEHHDLNVGLFALGWFQTLFLYLPSMPSTTVCHIWDIWLVERSFKIFFRVATAILFLSQPTLLNQDLEGMMTYLNTFPDATLLRRDILVPCALQIKITNRMLVEIEMEVAKFDQSQQGNEFFPV